MRRQRPETLARNLADEALQRSIHSSGGGSGITQLTGEVLAGPGSGAQVATVPGGYASTYYVTPSGNDTTGNGTIYKPWATLSHALVSAASGTPAVILVGAGTYTENVALVPNVDLVGIDGSGRATSINGNVSLAAAWTAASGSGAQACLVNLTVDGTTTLDFATVSNADGTVVLINVTTFGTCAFTGFGASLGNNVVTALSFFDLAVTVTGMGLGSQATGFNSLALVSTGTLETNWASNGDSVLVGVSLTGGTASCIALLVGTGVQGTLTLSGTTASYTTSSTGVPHTVTLSGGAAAPVITNNASGLAYTPAVSGNWAGSAPTTVQQALDRIAANTTNAHPIP
jgi:hypothetical protein